MENLKHFFAVDLGATSGRTIVGFLEDGKVKMDELTRFDNNLISTGGHVSTSDLHKVLTFISKV
jgi:hypothetical protein